MPSTSPSIDPMITGDLLDQLFLDCSELESLVASIAPAVGGLKPAVEQGVLTVEHLMGLAYRIEAAERGLISVAHQISDAASAIIQHRQRATATH